MRIVCCIISFEHDNPIGDGQTIAGLENGDMNPDIKWKVQYEDSLIQPIRDGSRY